jgi:hypothetical protein
MLYWAIIIPKPTSKRCYITGCPHQEAPSAPAFS